MGGFNGTADTSWGADAVTMTGKSNGGVPCVDTLRKSETTACKVTSTVDASSAKHSSTGRMIREKSDYNCDAGDMRQIC